MIDQQNEKSNRIKELKKPITVWEAADRIEQLVSELDLMKTAGIIEIASRNNRVTEYMFHWEGRALDAEAKLAKAVEALRECEAEIDQYIWQEYPSDHPVHERYRKRDLSANPARIALAELEGEKK